MGRSRLSYLEVAERDGIIAKMRSQHIQTLAIIEERDMEMSSMTEREKECKKTIKKIEKREFRSQILPE